MFIYQSLINQNMKKIILLCLFLAGMSAVSFAQGNGTPADKAAALKNSLALTDDQTAKVTAIYTAHNNSMDSLRKQDNGDYGAMMKKMMPVIMSTNDKIKAVLNPTQAATFQIKIDAQNAAMKKMIEGTPPY
jgi:protein CpxP